MSSFLGSLPIALLLVAHAACAVTAAVHALLQKHDPRAAWSWIVTCCLFPVGGPLLYYVFGINRLRQRAQYLVGIPDPIATGGNARTLQIPTLLGVSGPDLRELVRIGGAMSGSPLEFGNRIGVLHNGEEAYTAMVERIAGAQGTVHFCTYILEPGRVAEQFIAALCEAKERGVEVRVLIDGMSELFFGGRFQHRLTRAGVASARFLAPRMWPPRLSVNLRNHRKLLIIDGTVAFMGGMNIRDRQMVEPPTARTTVDLHFEIKGPVVGQLEACFASDWHLAFGEHVPAHRAAASPCGQAACRAISDGPNEDVHRLAMVLVSAIFQANERLSIMTPYFVPDAVLIVALQAAALRGVRVEIILPARSNQRYVDFASRKILEQLLGRGVNVWLHPGSFVHTKLFLVDGYYAQIGSANLDQRSLSLNFEIALEVFDHDFVSGLDRVFNSARASSVQLAPSDLTNRTLLTRVRDAACWLFSPYL